MKTKREQRRQVYAALTKRGRDALQSLRRKLQVSQSDAVEFAVILADCGGLSASDILSRESAKTQRILEGL